MILGCFVRARREGSKGNARSSRKCLWLLVLVEHYVGRDIVVGYGSERLTCSKGRDPLTVTLAGNSHWLAVGSRVGCSNGLERCSAAYG